MVRRRICTDRCFDADFCSIAWQVNFNLKVTSFEEDLQGLRNLLDLAVSSQYTVPPKFMFVSSIGVLASEYTPYTPTGADIHSLWLLT